MSWLIKCSISESAIVTGPFFVSKDCTTWWRFLKKLILVFIVSFASQKVGK